MDSELTVELSTAEECIERFQFHSECRIGGHAQCDIVLAVRPLMWSEIELTWDGDCCVAQTEKPILSQDGMEQTRIQLRQSGYFSVGNFFFRVILPRDMQGAGVVPSPAI